MAGMEIPEALNVLYRTLLEVASGLKRPGIPAELKTLFGPASLGPRHVPALSHLMMEGPMSVGALAARLGLALPTTSLFVGQLTQEGLVERHEDPSDRRRTLVRIADERRDVVETWLEARARPMRRALERMTPVQRQAFCDGLELLAEELSPNK